MAKGLSIEILETTSPLSAGKVVPSFLPSFLDSMYLLRWGLRLTLLSPEIVHAALTGNLPDGFSVDCLKQALPVLWSEQKKFLGIK